MNYQIIKKLKTWENRLNKLAKLSDDSEVYKTQEKNSMKAKEVMKVLDISRRTLTRYITKGVIKGNRLPTGRYIYDDESVLKLADKKKYIIVIVDNRQGE